MSSCNALIKWSLPVDGRGQTLSETSPEEFGQTCLQTLKALPTIQVEVNEIWKEGQ